MGCRSVPPWVSLRKARTPLDYLCGLGSVSPCFPFLFPVFPSPPLHFFVHVLIPPFVFFYLFFSNSGTCDAVKLLFLFSEKEFGNVGSCSAAQVMFASSIAELIFWFQSKCVFACSHFTFAELKIEAIVSPVHICLNWNTCFSLTP